MARVVIYPLLACAFITFMIISPYMKQQRHHDGRHGLSRRLGHNFTVPNFDPLLVNMQRLAAEKGLVDDGDEPISLDKTYEPAAVEGANEYFTDEGKLNVTLRFFVLFPLLDNRPKDGKVSLEELEAWNIEQAIDRLNYRTIKAMELRDKDGDGEISFSEYLPQFSAQDIERNEMGNGEAGWWMERFRNADSDRNGTLNLKEFTDFLYPEDSSNEEIKKWNLREKIKEIDEDDDGKLNYEEFSQKAYLGYRSYTEYYDEADVHSAEKMFQVLDLNKDGFLEVDELIPIHPYLKPGEISFAKYFSSYQISRADDNKDGSLTIDEMLNHELVFYSSLYGQDETDDDDEFHEEL
ncbi:hypothetical protein Tsubulata_034917 [Turnera subulata]|uniref:EF-hand domain-containing protein n=1 Tax=Turnera subulata TaxID=218843 RepID=A0A9Q0G2D7_9ROSI|nr:hypothetical protein Tsubulata_034917 [Turnera subulata]